MGTKGKLTLAAGFVGAVAIAAAAFGQTGGGGSGGSSSNGGSTARSERRAAAAQQRGDRHCGRAGPRVARRVVHGELKVATRAGGFEQLTIKRADGENITATASDET
ncbi:MAG: hypothetical protein E6G68_02080 [Actinobacteria bacterium]|nr:MAG: hypothetical protein E6G68_02080 [Actinomycetota bacterium]